MHAGANLSYWATAPYRAFHIKQIKTELGFQHCIIWMAFTLAVKVPMTLCPFDLLPANSIPNMLSELPMLPNSKLGLH